MKKEWQNQHLTEESVPSKGGGPTALEPPEDIYHVMQGRLILIPEAQETVEDLPQDAADWIKQDDTGFAFDEVRVHDWGLMDWPGSPHGALYFEVEIWASRPHRHVAATYEQHAWTKIRGGDQS
jgi:hypothetical protein